MTKTGSTTTSCSYQATCTDNGYECDASTGLCGTKTCNSESGCTSLMAQYRNKASTLCKTAQTQTCPTTGWTMGTGVGFNTPSLSGSTCTYTPKCTNGGTLYNGNAVSNGATITCTLGGTESTACTTDNLGTKFRPFNCVIPVTCPPVDTFGTLEHGSIGTPTKPNVGTCEYALQCNDGYTLQGDETLQCSGTYCNIDNLRQQLGYRSCQSNTIQCPTDGLSTWSEHGTVTKTNPSNNSCKYTFSCDTGYSLNPLSPTYVTCSGTTGCTSSWLASKLTSYSCQQDFTCPSKADFSGLLPEHMLISEPTPLSGNKCKYTLSCQGSDYSLNPSNTNTVTCTGSQCTETGVLALIEGTYTCQYSPTFTCPDPHDLQKPDVMTISRPTLDSSTQTCTYDLGCVSGYAIPTAPSNGVNPPTISCTGDECSNTEHLQELLNTLQNYKLARCGKIWSTEACSTTYAEGNNAAGTITTYWNSLDYNGTMCILNGKCDELHECIPGTLGSDYCDGPQGCGAGMGSEGVTEDCLELVQNYKNVSCSNDCPTVAKVEQFVLDNINYSNSVVGTEHFGGRCVYKVECENGNIMEASCLQAHGCKLNSSDWVYPPCSYY